jgi:hypothetical protein
VAYLLACIGFIAHGLPIFEKVEGFDYETCRNISHDFRYEVVGGLNPIRQTSQPTTAMLATLKRTPARNAGW